jgi:chromosome segregation ATPase
MEQETELERVAQEKLAYDQEIESFKSSLSAKDIEIEGFKGKNEELEGILKSLESSLAAAEEKVLEGQANLTLSNEELGKEKLRTVELQKSLEDTVTAFEKYKQENQKNGMFFNHHTLNTMGS